MSPRRSRGRAAPAFAAPALLLAALLLPACGQAPDPAPVAAGAPASTTTVVVLADGDAPSTVDGLTAAEVREAVEAPEPAGRARVDGPVAQAVRLASGATVWRVRIPGRFPVRSARVVVSVAGRELGEGVPGPRLQGLVAITRNPAGIATGATVTYGAPGQVPTAAGRLVVVR